jgi:hypothetical protein
MKFELRFVIFLFLTVLRPSFVKLLSFVANIYGFNATTVNGIYEPTTEVSNGICIYRKAGDLNKWLEYGGGGKAEWVIKKTAGKGHGRGWAALHIDSLMVPEQAGAKGGGVGW